MCTAGMLIHVVASKYWAMLESKYYQGLIDLKWVPSYMPSSPSGVNKPLVLYSTLIYQRDQASSQCTMWIIRY